MCARSPSVVITVTLSFVFRSRMRLSSLDLDAEAHSLCQVVPAAVVREAGTVVASSLAAAPPCFHQKAKWDRASPSETKREPIRTGLKASPPPLSLFVGSL